jgi:hypothetical protein
MEDEMENKYTILVKLKDDKAWCMRVAHYELIDDFLLFLPSKMRLFIQSPTLGRIM